MILCPRRQQNDLRGNPLTGLPTAIASLPRLEKLETCDGFLI
jgi:hypothetical protein